MKIKTWLQFNIIISLGIPFLILLSFAWYFRAVIIAERNADLVDEMRKIAFERVLLRDEYLLYREDRAKTQWLAKSKSLRDRLEMAAPRFEHVEDKTLLEDARKDFNATFSTFSRIMEDRARRAPVANTEHAFSDAESESINQTFLKAYSLTDNIDRLHESAHKAATNARNRGALVAVVFILVWIMAIIINSTGIIRTLSKRIVLLGEGVHIIGAGDLDHRISVEGDDELSGLALASNEMAAKLSKSYTSVDNLQKEIAERKKAEEEREKVILELKDALANVKTLSGMLPICASCKKIRDDKGYWSNVESYITEHSDVSFSHGVCPECEKKMYEELEKLKRPEMDIQ